MDKNEANFGTARGTEADGHRDVTRDDLRTPHRGDDVLREDLAHDGEAHVTLHEERLVAGTEKVRSNAVRLRVKVVTEEQTVTVPLRREVLEIIELDDDPETLKGAGGLRKPREIVLHEERVAVETVAYERVRVTRQKVREDVTVEADVAREVLEIDGDEDLHRR